MLGAAVTAQRQHRNARRKRRNHRSSDPRSNLNYRDYRISRFRRGPEALARCWTRLAKMTDPRRKPS
jgi:hypothetical protein